jgi:cellobiose-specific phosphotransferase system component IIA
VLEGLDAFVHTERFLHKLDQARKELDEADAEHATHLQQLASTGRTESMPVVEVPEEDVFMDCATDRAVSMPAVLEVSTG